MPGGVTGGKERESLGARQRYMKLIEGMEKDACYPLSLADQDRGQDGKCGEGFLEEIRPVEGQYERLLGWDEGGESSRGSGPV